MPCVKPTVHEHAFPFVDWLFGPHHMHLVLFLQYDDSLLVDYIVAGTGFAVYGALVAAIISHLVEYLVIRAGRCIRLQFGTLLIPIDVIYVWLDIACLAHTFIG